VLLDQLARTLESLDRTEEALDIYERLVQDFPQSAFARTASERVAALRPDSGV
jgi:outer membrane protein assembly factor BamD (BamD/ComL family)